MGAGGHKVTLTFKCCAMVVVHLKATLKGNNQMSKGPGKVERAIEKLLDKRPNDAFTIEQVCSYVYPGQQIERRHRGAVLRAAANVTKRRPSLQIWKSNSRGEKRVFVTADNLQSFGMGRLKTIGWPYNVDYPDEKQRERMIRASMKKGGKHYEHVQSSGTWYQDVKSNQAEVKARLAGDKKALRRILAERERKEELISEEIRKAFAGVKRRWRR
jgi:hypothetical protein